MLTDEETHQLQSRLEIHRRTLAHFLKQQAALSVAYMPPGTMHGINEARESIQQVKEVLRGAGITVEDHPDDHEQLPSRVNSSVKAVLDEYDLLWLSTLLKHAPDGETVDIRNVFVELLDRVPENFEPTKIDHHFCIRGSFITLLGRCLINPDDHIVKRADRLASTIRDILRKTPTRNVITAQELAQVTGEAELAVAITLELMAGLMGGGYFHSSGTSYGIRGWASINVNEGNTFRNYVNFESIKFLVNQALA